MWRAHQNEAIRVMGSDFKTINYAQRRKKPKKEQFWACPSKIEGKVTRTGQFWLQIRNLRRNCGLESPTPILLAKFVFRRFFCLGTKMLPWQKSAKNRNSAMRWTLDFLDFNFDVDSESEVRIGRFLWPCPRFYSDMAEKSNQVPKKYKSRLRYTW